MFNILEADIVIFQELKIQRKDLRDDMVLIPGWDCFFSLPKHKKVCFPIRAEEGVTGTLCPPNSTVCYRDLPTSIGGYPTVEQLSGLDLDADALDSEGRCVVLEFPAFVLLGVYCPANRDETRDGFRLGFLNALDSRIRNLITLGKRVVVAGDLNVSRDEIDSAHALQQIRKQLMTKETFASAPARQIFNQLVGDNKTPPSSNTEKSEIVLYDICRSFHPTRSGMYTCWEQRINARPGNFGARIDYVLCSLDMKHWISSADIQEGLMGSDHCPVYAIFQENVELDGKSFNIIDLMNPTEQRNRSKQSTLKDLLPLSGKLIPEFNRRRNIREMFLRQSCTSDKLPSHQINQSILPNDVNEASEFRDPLSLSPDPKRTRDLQAPSPKRRKKYQSVLSANQKTIRGFFDPRQRPKALMSCDNNEDAGLHTNNRNESTKGDSDEACQNNFRVDSGFSATKFSTCQRNDTNMLSVSQQGSWSEIFKKKEPPRCDGHDEPCISLVTKKQGINYGRSFWICSRPLGPTGDKQFGTQWRCSTFIWSSDWNSQQ
ncbi:Class II abasic (AP) endonuclease [Ophidiomyces ophidiicola]|uniref:Class II abasic (AP) endonuclease n=1 Tax=Ophidiomyces ophidiicola TaxID=1387563 RepID=A0ACB8UYW5_9EURO|nr:Class II abasic (AP) endonuclease [Ophidiomyces ophidiicola]KAI1950058.1 Class II abasic (AP) endonuclease [Ophidiomyces ophidiicola]KAI1959455.1 Class II abasic (AP) endonuclease [Ophidiomyces ophidiicola]KAI1973794.1 Class II abasic (AP) endonuclease [Ophidiomyces ophidiicola]KAI2032265.1 Class II abasic (AP) endonuclease [Ophidiomyces ophidiicola]